jgi:amicyanin
MLRPMIASTVLGAAVGSVLAAGVLFAQAEGTPNTVTIDNFSFAPATVMVKAGTTVTWTNRDDIPHGIVSANNAFKRGPALDTDDSFSFTFTTPGTYQYFCYLHPKMVGSIVVEATTGSNAKADIGRVADRWRYRNSK